MAKKIDFEKTFKKIENATGKAEIIMRNRLIIALFLIVDGITIIFNPNSSLTGIARSIILIIILAALSTLMANLCAKTKDIKSIIISLIILVISIITYIYPDIISAYMQLLLSLFIIYDGLSNILNLFHLNRLTDFTSGLAKKYENISSRKKINKDIDKEMEVQGDKYIKPLKNIVNKTSNSSILYIVINLATIILGILLLFSSFSMVVWGIIFLYTGISDLIIAMKTMNISSKLKEKKYKDILYDIDNQKDKEKNKSSKGEKVNEK